MTDNIIAAVVTILTAIVGIAVLAVLVSGKAKTSDVINAAGGAFSQSIGAAVSPVTGQMYTGQGAPGYPYVQ